MDRDELQTLSLDELRTLAQQRGIAQVGLMARSQIVDQLGGPPASSRARRLTRRVAGLFRRMDQILGRSLARFLARPARIRARPPALTDGRPGQTGAAPAAGASPPSGSSPASGPSAPPASDAAREVVYSGPAPSSGHRYSSSAAVRGPQASAGAVDRANLSEEMARTYAAEGHRDEAIAIYRLLLQERPGDPDLLHRLAELEDHASEDKVRAGRPRLGPSPTGPHTEPFSMLDLEELPETYGVDEVEVLYKDPWWSFVYWEVTEAGIEAARDQLGPSSDPARLVLRMFTTQPGPGGAARETRDVPLTWNHGRRYLDIQRPGAFLRVAVGLLSAEGYFASIAHSSLVRMPPPHPSPSATVEWMQVQPPRGRGEARERLTVMSRVSTHKERSLSWRVAMQAAHLGTIGVGAEAPGAGERAPAGTSEPGQPPFWGTEWPGPPLGSGSGGLQPGQPPEWGPEWSGPLGRGSGGVR